MLLYNALQDFKVGRVKNTSSRSSSSRTAKGIYYALYKVEINQTTDKGDATLVNKSLKFDIFNFLRNIYLSGQKNFLLSLSKMEFAGFLIRTYHLKR